MYNLNKPETHLRPPKNAIETLSEAYPNITYTISCPYRSITVYRPTKATHYHLLVNKSKYSGPPMYLRITCAPRTAITRVCNHHLHRLSMHDFFSR